MGEEGVEVVGVGEEAEVAAGTRRRRRLQQVHPRMMNTISSAVKIGASTLLHRTFSALCQFLPPRAPTCTAVRILPSDRSSVGVLRAAPIER